MILSSQCFTNNNNSKLNIYTDYRYDWPLYMTRAHAYTYCTYLLEQSNIYKQHIIMVIYWCLDLLPSSLISVCYAQAITNGYATGIGPSPFSQDLPKFGFGKKW